MRETILVLLLSAVTSTVAAEPTRADSLYAKWCDRQSGVERVPPEERARHIAQCVEALEEADRNPDAGRRDKGREEEG